MLEIGDICPDWNFLGPFNERVTISMPPIAGRFSILIFYHSQNKVLETIFTKVSDNRELLDSLDVRLFSITSLNKQSQPFMLPGLGAQPNFNTAGLGVLSEYILIGVFLALNPSVITLLPELR